MEIGQVFPIDIDDETILLNSENNKKLEQKNNQSKNMALVKFKQQLVETLEKTSRTAKGVSDVSSSNEKPELSTIGSKLEEKKKENFEKAIEFIWEERYRVFSSQTELRNFIEKVAIGISEGLLNKGQGLFRTWETKFAHQAKPQNIERDFNSFIGDLFQKIHSPPRRWI